MGKVFSFVSFQSCSKITGLTSSNDNELASGLLSSLITDLQKLEKSLTENPISFQWCTEAMHVIRKGHSEFLLYFVGKSKVPISEDGVKWMDEYMGEAVYLMDLCNFFKSATSRISRYQLMVNFAVRKLYDPTSITATNKTEIERLEEEHDKLYGIMRWKDETISKDEITGCRYKKTSSGTVNYAIRTTITILSLFIFSVILYPIKIKLGEEVYHELHGLKLFLSSLKKLVSSFSERFLTDGDETELVLMESKMIKRAVEDIEAHILEGIENRDQFLKSIDLLEKRSMFLKDGVEMFEYVVNLVFEDVVEGRNKVLGMITADYAK